MKHPEFLPKGCRIRAGCIACAVLSVRLLSVWWQLWLLARYRPEAEPATLLQGLRQHGVTALVIPLAAAAARWLLTAPLTPGLRRYYLLLRQRQQTVPWQTVLCCYRPGRYGAALRLALCTGALRVAAAAVCLLPAAVLLGLGAHTGAGSALQQTLRLLSLVCGVLAIAVGLAAAGLFMLRYAPAPYLLRRQAGRALRQARRLSRGHRELWLRAYLRSFPLLIGCGLILPYFWCAPALGMRLAGAMLLNNRAAADNDAAGQIAAPGTREYRHAAPPLQKNRRLPAAARRRFRASAATLRFPAPSVPAKENRPR
ncbi:MAG: hypothetical protein IKI50_02495 [Clostridia bacterium]|nr:hypothetical protein [Clostridia bacterium]